MAEPATMEELASRVFAARDAAHRAHWKTGSYAAHMALGEFYDAAIDALDDVVECHQGTFGLLGDFSVECGPVSSIAQYLAAEVEWIEANAEVLANENDTISNLIDALAHVYRKAIYKLTKLV